VEEGAEMQENPGKSRRVGNSALIMTFV